MPLVTSREILLDARDNRYAVGAFNAHNMETVEAIVSAAEEERSPVIVQISQGTVRYAGLGAGADLVKSRAARSPVPVVLNLDHGMDIDLCRRCLDAGFTALMYDGSGIELKRHRDETGVAAPDFDTVVKLVQSERAFEENVKYTKQVVDMAHARAVPVEGELGRIPRVGDFTGMGLTLDRNSGLPAEVGDMTRRLYADPERAREFVRLTGCDSLAVAFGSVHGMETNVQPLDIGHLREIGSKTGVPLVLHGSSGVLESREKGLTLGIDLRDHEGGIVDAIEHGVAKINVSTILQTTFVNALRASISENPDTNDIRVLFPPAVRALREKVRSFMRTFRSSGKAG